MIRLEQRGYRVGKPDDVGVVAFEFHIVLFTNYFDHIHGAYFASSIIEFVKIRDYLLLVRNSHIKSAKIVVLRYDFHNEIDVGNVEVDIFSADIFGSKLLVEVNL